MEERRGGVEGRGWRGKGRGGVKGWSGHCLLYYCWLWTYSRNSKMQYGIRTYFGIFKHFVGSWPDVAVFLKFKHYVVFFPVVTV